VPIVDPGEYPRESLAIEASLEPANHESTDSDLELAAREDSKEPASESLQGQAASSKSQTEVELARLLILSQIISQEDFDEARRTAGDALTRLVEQHKVSRELYDVARECQSMIAKESITAARAVILLNYCQRTRAKFYDAIRDLNWDVD
jgi:hypothetical protein